MTSKDSSAKTKQTDGKAVAGEVNGNTKSTGGADTTKKNDKKEKNKEKKHKPDSGNRLDPVDGNLWVW